MILSGENYIVSFVCLVMMLDAALIISEGESFYNKVLSESFLLSTSHLISIELRTAGRGHPHVRSELSEL